MYLSQYFLSDLVLAAYSILLSLMWLIILSVPYFQYVSFFPPMSMAYRLIKFLRLRHISKSIDLASRLPAVQPFHQWSYLCQLCHSNSSYSRHRFCADG